MNKWTSFTKEYTLITKGILFILMFMHHLFAIEFLEKYSVIVTMSDERLFINICMWCKICISGFAFLSAYGITSSLKSREENNIINGYFKVLCKR